MSTPERAGWYDDPEDESRLRYFDGIIWSDRTVPKQTRWAQPVTDPAQPATGPAQPGTGPAQPGTDVFGRPTPPGGAQPPYGQAPHGQAPYGHAAAATPEATTTDGQPLAGYGVRVAAYILDGFILAIINLVVAGWALWLWVADYWGFAWDAAVSGNQDAVRDLSPDELWGLFDWQYFYIALGLMLLVQMLYHVGFLAARGATPGKMVLGISVRRLDRPGPMGVGVAFMRVLLPLTVGVFQTVPLLGYLLGLIGVVDLVWPLRDRNRQALHDRIAGTQVVVGKRSPR